MGSPYKTAQLNKAKANKIALKWMKRSGQYKDGKITPSDEFIATEMAGQGFKGIKKAIVSIIADYGHRIEQKLSKKVKPTFGKKKTKTGGKIKKKK